MNFKSKEHKTRRRKYIRKRTLNRKYKKHPRISSRSRRQRRTRRTRKIRTRTRSYRRKSKTKTRRSPRKSRRTSSLSLIKTKSRAGRKPIDCLSPNIMHSYNWNSCYMDSVMFSLLSFPNNFVKNYIIKPDFREIHDRVRKLQINDIDKSRKLIGKRDIDENEINTVNRYIHNIHNEILKTDKECMLRNHILQDPLNSINKKPQYVYKNKRQHDAGEFLQAIFNTFYISNITVTKERTFRNSKTNDTMVSSVETQKTDPYIQFYPYELTKDFQLNKEEVRNLDKDNLYKGDDGKLYDTFVEKQTYSIHNQSMNKFLVIGITRTMNPENKDKTPIKILPNIYLDRSKLKLTHIIHHDGLSINSGHYTVYFQCKTKWYLYNDEYPRIETIGTFSNMIKNTDVNECSMMLFYS